MLELHSRARRTFRNKSHFHFAGVPGLRIVLPDLVELPGQDEAIGRLERQYAARLALSAIFVQLIPAAADLRFEDKVHQGSLADAVFLWPPGTKPGGEDFERAL